MVGNLTCRCLRCTGGWLESIAMAQEGGTLKCSYQPCLHDSAGQTTTDAGRSGLNYYTFLQIRERERGRETCGRVQKQGQKSVLAEVTAEVNTSQHKLVTEEVRWVE